MNLILLTCFIISFFTVTSSIPIWIRKARVNDIQGKDIHKLDGRKIAEMGGICVVVGFMFGTLTYLAITTYYPFVESDTILTLGILCSLLITTIIGLMDDMLGWKVGIRQYQKPILTVAATIPIAILFKGDSSMMIPFNGVVDFGVFYSILIIPLIITITTNGFNMLAGYNGLETGMGMIILGTLGILALAKGNYWAGILAYIMFFALFGFLAFNYYPAKLFPGNILTYSVGALIGITAVVSNQHKALFFLFIPYYLEFILKARGKMQKESFSKVRKDGGLYVNNIYGLEHVAVYLLGKVKKKVTELNVVWSIWLVEMIIAAIVVVVYL